MSTDYGRIAFTPAVQDQQERHGSKRLYDRQRHMIACPAYAERS